MVGRLLPSVVAMSLVGCFGPVNDSGGGIDDDYMDDQPPPGGCQTACPEPATDEGSPVGGPCLETEDCAADAICAAEFDGEVQSFLCQVACIPIMDPAQWCADDQACCDGSTCSPRGFCLPATGSGGLDSGDSGSGHATTDGTDGTSTGDSDASGTDTGSSTGAGSSTG